MNSVLDIFMSYQFVLFALGVFAITWLIRAPLEYFFPKLSTNVFWRTIALRAIPMALGAIVAWIAKNYSYPNNFNSTSDRIIIGMVAGLTSNMFWSLFKATVKSTIASKWQFVNSVVPGLNTNQTVQSTQPTNVEGNGGPSYKTQGQ